MDRHEDLSLPFNMEAERAVLGAFLIANASIDRYSPHLKAEHFYREAHRRIYRAVLSVHATGTAVDLVTLKHALTRTGELDEVGGPGYVAALIDGVPHSTNVEFYAQIVREHATRRAIILEANKMLTAAYECEEEPADLLAAADRAIAGLRYSEIDKPVALKDRAAGLVAVMERRVANQGQLLGLASGYPLIDRQVHGWQPGNMIVIAGRPSDGKSTIMLNSAVHVAGAGKRVAVFSLEMTREQLDLRLVSQLTQIDHERLSSGVIGRKDYDAMSVALQAISEMDLVIDDRSSHTIEDIRATCRLLSAERPLDLVAVDYFQLVKPSGTRRNANRTEELGHISNGLKSLAKELHVPVVVCAQLKRLAGSKPTLEDLRESGALEQDADVVLLLWPRKHAVIHGLRLAILAKNRDGARGESWLTLNEATVTFEDGPETVSTPVKDDDPEKPKKARPPKGYRAHRD